MKIDKYIRLSGYTSRRKAFELIEEHRVFVNGKAADFGSKINKGDVVLIDGKQILEKEFVPVYLVYNKPKGIICTTEKIENNIIDAINYGAAIYPVGRLDKDSEGLILLTNQSELINKITHSKFGHEKEYMVTLNLPVRTKFLKEISEGVVIKGEKTKPCKVAKEPGTKRIFRIILTQGLNRQIRRMCSQFGYQVIKLQRIRVLNITLEKLKTGEWRNMHASELEELLKQIEITSHNSA